MTSLLKIRWFAGCLSLLVLLATPSSAETAEKPSLKEELTRFLEQPRFVGAGFGVKIVSLDSGQTLFEHEPRLRLSPASNCKLYVAALALEQLGGDYRIVTPILATGAVSPTGELTGDLVIAGRGDPSWGARFKEREFWTTFDPFIAELKKAGVKRIRGDVVADATWLRVPPHGPGWVVDDLMDDYGAEISAITFVDNYVEFHVKPGRAVGEPCAIEFAEPLSGLKIVNRTATLAAGKEATLSIRRFPGSLDVEIGGGVALGGKTETTDASVPRPAQWFAVALREALQRAGIAVDGAARSVVWPEATPAAGVQLGAVTSPPMRQLVGDFLIPSQNLETDLILAHLGETTRTPATAPDKRSDDLGLDELNKFLRKIGVPAEDVIFDEGSGLSRNNLATADATITLLRFMAQHREATAYFEGLPSAGKNGTLRRRFKDLPVERNLRAKTGTLRWASALSGYVTTATGEKLAFSLMLNRYVAPAGRKASAELDEIVAKLTQ